MNPKLLVSVVAGIVMLPIAGVLGFTAIIIVSVLGAPDGSGSGDLPDRCRVAPVEDGLDVPKGSGSHTTTVALEERQLEVAANIINIGRSAGAGDKGVTIALMVALQESRLRNLANDSVAGSTDYPHDGVGSDHDSVNAFQQRPSQGWGSIDELMNERYAATAFYGGPTGPNEGLPRGLLDINSWQTMDKAEAAQVVQVSAFPDAYAQWEAGATKILNTLDAGVDECDEADFNGDVVVPLQRGYLISTGGEYGPRDIGGNASRWHAGVDLSYPGGPSATCGQPVYSAMDGVVTRADWLWVSIEHEDGFVISYLHMYEEDHLVDVGDKVAAGTQIGVIGNAGENQGMSFGCHLDFRIDTTMNTNSEVASLQTAGEIGAPAQWANFVDPQEFMALLGEPLFLGDAITPSAE